MIIFVVIVGYTVGHSDGDSDSATGETYKIEGKVTPPDNPPPDWLSVTTVSLDGGKRRAFLKDDNSFVFQVLYCICITFIQNIHHIIQKTLFTGYVAW